MSGRIETSELGEILRGGGLHTLFLPVISLVGRCVHAWEALIRGPENSVLHGSLQLLRASRAEGLEEDFEIAALETSIRTFLKDRPPVHLWLNVSADLLCRPGFVARLRDTVASFGLRQDEAMVTTRVLEGTHVPAWELALQLRGFQPFHGIVALDTIRELESGAELLVKSDLRCLKIGRFAVRDLSTNAVKRVHLRDLIRRAHERNIRVITEGVETRADLDVLLQFEPDYVQGFLFGPLGNPPRTDLSALHAHRVRKDPTKSDWTIGELLDQVPMLSLGATVAAARDAFAKARRASVLPVLDGMQPRGWLRRDSIDGLVDGDPIEAAMQTGACTALSHEAPEDVLERLPPDAPAVAILWEGMYQGIVPLAKLREEIERA